MAIDNVVASYFKLKPGNSYGASYDLILELTESDANQSTNTSKISGTLKLKSNNAAASMSNITETYKVLLDNKEIINETKSITINFPGSASGGTITLATINPTTITHNKDGTKSLTIQISITSSSSSYYVPKTSTTVTRDLELIRRSFKLDLSNVSNQTTVTVTKKGSSTPLLDQEPIYYDDELTTTFALKDSTSYDWDYRKINGNLINANTDTDRLVGGQNFIVSTGVKLKAATVDIGNITRIVYQGNDTGMNALFGQSPQDLTSSGVILGMKNIRIYINPTIINGTISKVMIGTTVVTQNKDSYGYYRDFDTITNYTFTCTVTDNFGKDTVKNFVLKKFKSYSEPAAIETSFSRSGQSGGGVLTVKINYFNDTFKNNTYNTVSQYNTTNPELNGYKEDKSSATWNKFTNNNEWSYDPNDKVWQIDLTQYSIFSPDKDYLVRLTLQDSYQANITNAYTQIEFVVRRSESIFEWTKEDFKFNVPVSFNNGIGSNINFTNSSHNMTLSLGGGESRNGFYIHDNTNDRYAIIYNDGDNILHLGDNTDIRLNGSTTISLIKPNVTSSSWVRGRDNALIQYSFYAASDSDTYRPFISQRTRAGSWEIGVYSNNTLHFNYISDSDYNNNYNNVRAGHVAFGPNGIITCAGINLNDTATSKKGYGTSLPTSGQSSGDVFFKIIS